MTGPAVAADVDPERLFGTDGVRGRANEDLTPELALLIGRALVTVLHDDGERRPSILVGRDPRWSGDMLEAALVAGITSAGGDAVCVGVVPTPGVAFLTARSSAAAGVMISASHNPVGDNGIKLFGPDGFKLSDDEELRVATTLAAGGGRRPVATRIGRRLTDPAAVARYIEHLARSVDVDLTGLRVVVDGANGAAHSVAPQVYRQLGAEVVQLHCSPDGANINEGCGSTHPEVVAEAVVAHAADLGVAHDGDADRVVAATHLGEVVDGDVILAVLARQAHLQGRLVDGTVVTTVMANLGFHHAMRDLGIRVLETAVGDRYVLDAMRAGGLTLGGEQSGHIIDLERATTGDGVLTALRLMEAVRTTGTPLAELVTVMRRLPQVLVNVPDVDRARLAGASGVAAAVAAAEVRLGEDGRILVRASGTEPLVRVMVEAVDERLADEVARGVADVVRSELGTGAADGVAVGAGA
ncbi:MAG: phosphoglucosamine mutase [Nitriliruptoraceae bacterium]